jgi:hypothetical protein
MADHESRTSGSVTRLLIAADLIATVAGVVCVILFRPDPGRVTVQHILISFSGATPTATRTKEAAEKLAHETLARVRNGEDFGKLMKELSDDPSLGSYTMCDAGRR